MDSSRPLKVRCGIWHKAVTSRSFKSCKLGGGASMDLDLFFQHIPQMLNYIEIWKIWEAKSTPQTIFEFIRPGHLPLLRGQF